MVVHGSEDALIDVTGGEATAAAIPGAELVVIDGMGHDLPLWALGRIAEALRVNFERWGLCRGQVLEHRKALVVDTSTNIRRSSIRVALKRREARLEQLQRVPVRARRLSVIVVSSREGDYGTLLISSSALGSSSSVPGPPSQVSGEPGPPESRSAAASPRSQSMPPAP